MHYFNTLFFYSDPSVRETSAEALGTLMKLVGEKSIGPFLVDLEKDNLRMSKIKEYYEKAVIAVKLPTAKKERPNTAPAKVPNNVKTAVIKPNLKKTSGQSKLRGLIYRNNFFPCFIKCSFCLICERISFWFSLFFHCHLNFLCHFIFISFNFCLFYFK